MDQVVNDAFLKSTATRNEVIEKKLAVLQRSNEEIERISCLYSRSRSYLDKLVVQTNEKLEYATNEVTAKKVEIEAFTQETVDSLTSELSRFDLTNNINREVSIDESLLNRLFNAPFETLAIKLKNFKEEKEKELERLRSSIVLNEEQLAESRKSLDSLYKAQAKEEKSISELKELVEKKTEESIQFEAELTAKNETLSKIQQECDALEEKRSTEAKNLADLEKKLLELSSTESEEVEKLNQKMNEEIRYVEEKIAKISLLAKYTDEINTLLPQNEKTKELLAQLAQADADLSQAMREAGNSIHKFVVGEGDKLENLSDESKLLQEQKRKMEAEVNEIKVIRHQLLLKQQEQNKKSAELNSIKERLRQKSLKVTHLVKTKREASLKKLEKAAMQIDIPNEKSANTLDYVTPQTKKVSSIKFRKNAQIRRISFESDFTKMASPNEEFSYPGIKSLTASTKKKVKEATAHAVALQEPVPVQRKSTIEDKTYDSSMDSSLLSGDTGTTQEGSMMGGMFSPLSNRFEDDPLVDKDQEEPVDFSMMDHFRDYTDRSKPSKKQTINRSDNDMAATPSPQDSVTRRFSSDIFLQENSPSDLSQNTSEPSVSMSSLNNGDADDDEEEDNDDDDNSLMFNDSDLDMDQSVWGSDM